MAVTQGLLQETETNLVGYLITGITSTVSTIDVLFKDAVTGEQRTPDANTKMFVIDKGSPQQRNPQYEIIVCASHSTTNGITTLTGCTRGLAYSGNSLSAVTANQKSHTANAEIGCVDVHYITNMATATLKGEGDVIVFPTFQNAADRDAVITSPTIGMMVSLIDEQKSTQYINGDWYDVAAGTVSVNTAYTSFNYVLGENITVSSGKFVPCYISDGTGGRTAGRLYKSDANDTTNGAHHCDGVIIVSGLTGDTAKLITSGTITGLSGLNIHKNYFVGDSAGAAEVQPGTISICIGQCLSSTSFFVNIRGENQSFFTGTGLSNGTTTQTMYVAKRPRVIKVFYSITAGSDTAANTTNVIGEAWYDTSGTLIKKFDHTVYQNLSVGSTTVRTWGTFGDGAPATSGLNGSIKDKVELSIAVDYSNIVLTCVVTRTGSPSTASSYEALIEAIY